MASRFWANSATRSIPRTSRSSLVSCSVFFNVIKRCLLGTMDVRLEATGRKFVESCASKPGSIAAVPKDMVVLLYSDQPNSWPAVYHSSLSCWEKVKLAKNFDPVRFGVETLFNSCNRRPRKFTPASTIFARCVLICFSSNVVWDQNNQFHNNPIYLIEQHTRPRFWYTVIANCQPTAGGGFSGVKYTIHDLNTFDTSSWNTEFGVNDQGVLYACVCVWVRSR